MKIILTITLMLTSLISFAGSISVEDPYVRLLPKGSMATGAFMTISNSSEKTIKLLSATTSKSKITQIHNHIKENGMMKMREIPYLEIPAKSSVKLKPGSFHIMLMQLRSDLVLGEKIKINLSFDNDEKITIDTPVKKINRKKM